MEGSSVSSAVTIFMYVVALGFAGIFAIVILKMMNGKIDLTSLLSETRDPGVPPGSPTKSSLSRFQLLVFTFVVAGLFLILSVENGQLIDVPNSVLGLLGISGGSYLVSKGLNK